MAESISRKRKPEDRLKPKLSKKFRRQKAYHSSSSGDEDETAKPTSQSIKPDFRKKKATKPVEEKEIEKRASQNEESGSEPTDSEAEDDSDGSNPSTTTGTRKIPKRRDPNAFSTSIHAILNSKLTSSKRPDPVLSRSAAAAAASAGFADEKLSQKAKKAIRDERRAALDKGRVKDVLAEVEQDGGAILEKEKQLRKTAQRGVVRLFNAVRAAQVQGEMARKETQTMVGEQGRKERVDEMSKEGFLKLIKGQT